MPCAVTTSSSSRARVKIAREDCRAVGTAVRERSLVGEGSFFAPGPFGARLSGSSSSVSGLANREALLPMGFLD